MSKKSVPPDNPEQSKRFIETAHDIETDESPETFEHAFKKIVTEKKPTTSIGKLRRKMDHE